jgi:predicted metalloprotease with PDZ domain
VVAPDFDDSSSASTWGYQWIDEGFTEYFARRILYENGLLTLDELVQLTNEDFKDLGQNQCRNIPYAELRRAAEEERFTNLHQRVGYYRGTLIALDWETRIRQATGERKTLADAIRETINAAAGHAGRLPEADFHDIMRRYNIDSRADFDRYILRGEIVPGNQHAYAPGYVLEDRILYDFAPGFDMEESRRRGTIAGVTAGGHAEQAGLRDGMELVTLANSRRFDPERPMTVTVRTDGRERAIEYFPKGDAMRVPIFRAVAAQGPK